MSRIKIVRRLLEATELQSTEFYVMRIGKHSTVKL